MSAVLLLMATHQGQDFLAEQLDSVAAQDHPDWELWISDDASRDRTRAIIAEFIARRPAGQVRLLEGPGQGATANFRSLLGRAELKGRHLAFCDQDDVWDADHLSRGLAALADGGEDLAVYGCRLRICDARLTQIGLSPLPSRPLGFRNALLQNMLSGNTMVMTPAAARLLQQAEAGTGPVPVHDWWAYQLITGAGGVAMLDPQPGVHYRQHGANVIGAGHGLHALIARAQRYLRGEHRGWAAQTAAAMAAQAARLTPENRVRLTAFAEALPARLPGKIAALRRAGVYLQSPRDRTAFWLALALGRF